jgi:very-short-patch-repair endonuclease
MSRMTPVARRLRRQQTSAEEAIWRVLRGRRLAGLKFRRQVPIAGFVADFACVEIGLTIEIDGVQHDDQIDADRRRRAAIEGAGYLEIRFTNAEVMERADWVEREILRAIDIAKTRAMRDAFPKLG